MNWIRTYKDYKPGEVHAPAPVAVNAPGKELPADGGVAEEKRGWRGGDD